MTRNSVEEGRVGGTEGGRSPTGVPPASAPADRGGRLVGRPAPEVLERPLRRRFTAEYKARLLTEADACSESGRVGALLRREGLYSSHLVLWRRQRDAGLLAGLTPKRRGRKPKLSPLEAENQQLRRENGRLRDKLRQAELIMDVQKKVSELLGIPLKHPESDESG